MTRREIIRLSLLSSLAALACRKSPLGDTQPDEMTSIPEPLGLGPLLSSSSGLLDLPAGFSALVVQQANDRMSCGNKVPGQPDGMTCHMNADGHYVLLRNHELSTASWCQRPDIGIQTDIFAGGSHPEEAYDAEMYGSVTRVVLDPDSLLRALTEGAPAAEAVVSSNLVLTGTEFNCSGGTIEGGWITCEETDREQHGYAFLTRVDDDALVVARERRIESWGRMKREGITLHPETGHVFMTEDHKSGCMYRFVPDDSSDFMGSGELQAMVLADLSDTDPEVPLAEGTQWSVRWIPVPDPQASKTPCRDQARALGAARFNRCEGSVWDGESLWFIASTAGPVQGGQIYRYEPASQTLTLCIQVTDRSILSMPDNLTLAPWGDLVLAEDNYNNEGGATHQHLRVLRRDGSIIDLARNPENRSDHPGAEISGPCFSPDGRVLFVNIQRFRNLTVAITGPWEKLG
jgi:secreted PhoX family phosphatase